MKISSGDLSQKKSGRTSTNQGVNQAQNNKQGMTHYQNKNQGRTAVECTANYSENSPNNKKSPTDSLPSLYIPTLPPWIDYRL